MGAEPGELPCVGSWERPASYGVQMPTIKADLVLPLLCVSKMLSQIGLDCIVSFFLETPVNTEMQWAEVFGVFP